MLDFSMIKHIQLLKVNFSCSQSKQLTHSYLRIFSIDNILLSVQEPVRDFILSGISHYSDNFFHLKHFQYIKYICCKDKYMFVYKIWIIKLTSSSEHSPARLSKSISAFFKTILAYRRPTPLMAVMANMTFLLPSMFVPMTRRMCWNFSGITRDWKIHLSLLLLHNIYLKQTPTCLKTFCKSFNKH